jgi:hypothetical protein
MTFLLGRFSLSGNPEFSPAPFNLMQGMIAGSVPSARENCQDGSNGTNVSAIAGRLANRSANPDEMPRRRAVSLPFRQ